MPKNVGIVSPKSRWSKSVAARSKAGSIKSRTKADSTRSRIKAKTPVKSSIVTKLYSAKVKSPRSKPKSPKVGSPKSYDDLPDYEETLISPPKASKAASPINFADLPPIFHLPTELLQEIYDKLPNVSDRAALAATSRRMEHVSKYDTAVHYIQKASDIELVIKHKASHVVLLNGALFEQMSQSFFRMPSVTHLTVENLKLQRLSDSWPVKLEYLNCQSNRLRTFHGVNFPSTFKELNCSSNELYVGVSNFDYQTDYDLSWPDSLRVLTCENNFFETLPPRLPPNLVDLNCNHNSLRKLPPLPRTLLHLNCLDNKLETLPSLPPSLKTLVCDTNELTRLPALPRTLVHLVCKDNGLNRLSTLPPSLEILDCSLNDLEELPTLPPKLKVLKCNDNQLTKLPTLPSTLKILYCSSNEFTSLPHMPLGLVERECEVKIQR